MYICVCMLHIGVINVAFIDCLLCIFHVNSGLMCRLSEIVNNHLMDVSVSCSVDGGHLFRIGIFAVRVFRGSAVILVT